MDDRVKPDSLITLHYRLANADDDEFVSTFDGNPATLQLGSGELAPTLEACLVGLPVGEQHVFMLDADQAFGPHNPELMQRFDRAALPDNAPLELYGIVEFAAPDGSTYAGMIRELDATSALIDLNHPLAGKAIRFEVKVIGVL